MIEIISRLSLILIWIYHGLVPKIIFKHEQEVLMNSIFFPFLPKEFTLWFSGIMELIYAGLLILFFRSAVMLYPSLLFSVFATLAIWIKIPELFEHAFNPFSTNLAVFALSLINLIALRKKQSASDEGI